MEAHALTALLNNDISYPFLCLLASGGHCLLAVVKNINEFYLLGDHMDSAPGECFDKVSRALRLQNIPEYRNCNGGRAIELAAYNAIDSNRFTFPLPLQKDKNCQFSFGGIKTNAFYQIQKIKDGSGVDPDETIPYYEDFCAGFLKAMTKHMLHRTQRAIEYCEKANLLGKFSEPKSIVFSGGVACNDFMFNALTQMAKRLQYDCYRPAKNLCTDNGVMIAWNGVEKWKEHKDMYLNLELDSVIAESKCPLEFNHIKNVELANIAPDWVKVPLLRSKTMFL